MRDREGSRFSTCLQLHDRYLLLDLLGKGGFSEVFLVGARLFGAQGVPVGHCPM